MTTFAELQIPFAWYEGPVDTCDMYRGPGTCALCSRLGHLFVFGIGGYVELACGTCGVKTDWHVADAVPSCSCGAVLEAPLRVGRAVVACHACFRAGHAKRTHDTELGMVTPELARDGLTHGVPGPALPGWESSSSPNDPSWRRYHVRRELLEELVRTPTFTTWQGCYWSFHCQQPMIFVGEWRAEQWIAFAGCEDAARALLPEVVPRDLFFDDLWDDLSSEESGIGGLYTFRCPKCGTHQASWDST